MFKRSILTCALLAAWGQAQANSDIDTLRAELAQLKQHYETRLKDLEARLQSAEARQPAPEPADRPAAASGFNPEVSLILQGQYAHRKDLPERGITGFLPAGEHAHGTERGFSVDHTELVMSASVDPYFRGYANIALVDETAEVEEAWFQTLALGEGFSLKGGRFYSGLGYVNEQHPHAWDFADAPLMYQALFGERLSHDGLQLKWLAPTETFLEFGLEAGRGQNFPGAERSSNGIGAWSAFAKIGGDVGVEHSWRAGLAHLRARPQGRAGHWEDTNEVEAETFFTGTSRAWVADFVWKWAPDGNPKYRNFKFQTEYFRRSEDGDLKCADIPDADDSLCDGSPDSYRSRQSGWYAQGVYQFMPRWRVGARYDRLDSGRVDFGALPLEATDYNPTRWSLMTDWSPSEFSRVRLQWARDRSMEGLSENQVTLQYIMSLGAHGAHKF